MPFYRRFKCPVHKEETPSLVVYDDHGWCYGCGTYFTLAELKKHEIELEDRKRYVEDTAKTIERIRTLPLADIRGLKLPHDNDSYYIVFPGTNYYKRRFNGSRGYPHKYYSPSGVQKPLFRAQEGRDRLFIVEGELNALSIAQLGIEGTIISPGGSNDFLKKEFLTSYLEYDKIIIIVDLDVAGVKAAIMTKELLKSNGKYDITVVEMERDANDILEKDGKEALKKEIEKQVGLEV